MPIRSALLRALCVLFLIVSEACSGDTTASVVDMAVEQDAAVLPPEDPPLPQLAVIHEIHASPADKTSREEFVEIASVSDTPIDLSGWRLTGGIAFTFPSGTTLAPSGFLVIAENPTTLATRFPKVPALGP